MTERKNKKRFNSHLDPEVVEYLDYLQEQERIVLGRKQGYRMAKGKVVSEAVKETYGFRKWKEDSAK